MDSTFEITNSSGEIIFIDGYLTLGLEHVFFWFIIYFKNVGREHYLKYKTTVTPKINILI
jgi:hypothetical protein